MSLDLQIKAKSINSSSKLGITLTMFKQKQLKSYLPLFLILHYSLQNKILVSTTTNITLRSITMDQLLRKMEVLIFWDISYGETTVMVENSRLCMNQNSTWVFLSLMKMLFKERPIDTSIEFQTSMVGLISVLLDILLQQLFHQSLLNPNFLILATLHFKLDSFLQNQLGELESQVIP